MKVALDNFAAMDVSPKAVILGDMLELGPTSDELHAEVVEQVKAGRYDKVFLCGEHFQKVGAEFATFKTTDELMKTLKSKVLKGYHILIKGSHGMALEKLVPEL
jgi:UDP-N-acetylmuramoyl-tripeptide--D-alanyl-D-alanine ligase